MVHPSLSIFRGWDRAIEVHAVQRSTFASRVVIEFNLPQSAIDIKAELHVLDISLGERDFVISLPDLSPPSYEQFGIFDESFDSLAHTILYRH